MREPASTDGAKEPNNAVAAGVSGVSIQDRRRIDSDVRAFLREPSTPWIVFDRDGRPPSQLAVGEMLSVPRRTLLSEHGFYQATQAALATRPSEDVTPDSSIEPSSVALASDLAQEDAAAVSPDAAISESDALTSFATARIFGMPSRRVLGIAAASFALVAAAGIATVAVPSSAGASGHAFKNAAAAQATGTERAPLAALAAAPAKPAVVTAAPIAAAPTAAKVVQPAPKKHARLSIGGEARSREVFLDGKRLLGRGARNFTILCGPHTIAVGTRTDMREVDVPCTGSAELVIAK